MIVAGALSPYEVPQSVRGQMMEGCFNSPISLRDTPKRHKQDRRNSSGLAGWRPNVIIHRNFGVILNLDRTGEKWYDHLESIWLLSAKTLRVLESGRRLSRLYIDREILWPGVYGHFIRYSTFWTSGGLHTRIAPGSTFLIYVATGG
jgi:hypothetical protein